MTSRVDVLLDTARAGRDPFALFPWNPARVLAGLTDKEAALVAQLVNLAAAERYGTAVPAAGEPC